MRRRVILAAGIALITAAAVGGCAEAKSISPCVELTTEERGGLLAAGVTHAGKSKNDAGYLIFLTPTVYERSGNGDRNGIDFHYQGVRDPYGTDVSVTKINTIPAELQPLIVTARACAAEL